MQPPFVDEKHRKLCFRDKKPFTVHDVDAWWLAYDAIQVIEQELRSANELIRRSYPEEPQLRAHGVEGNASPAALSEYIRTDKSWKPTNAEVKVGDVESVVKRLGGRQLYGDDDE